MKAKIYFQWADYLVFAIFLVVSTVIGIVFGIISHRKKTNSKDFLTGGGDMHWFPVAISMQSSFASAIFILSNAGEVYTFGINYAFITLAFLVGLPLCAEIFLPIYHRLNLISAYEYLERRHNKTVRTAGALTFCLMIILYLSVVLYAPALALAQVTGLSITLASILCGLVCTIYTTAGGMKATIWNDFLQMAIIMFGLILLLIFSLIKVGGFEAVYRFSLAGGRLVPIFDPDPTLRTTFWTQLIGPSYINLTVYASSQTIILKFISIKKVKDAKKSIYAAAIGSFLLSCVVCFMGLVAFTYFDNCDPLSTGRIKKIDQILPLLAMEVMNYNGLPGIFLAVIFGAALSSISGSLTALASVTLSDFMLPICKMCNHTLSERAKTIITKILIAAFGLMVTGMSLAAEVLGESTIAISLGIFGFIGGPLTGLVIFSMLLPFINSWGALSGLICSLGITAWIAIGAMRSQHVYPRLPVSIENCPIFNNTHAYINTTEQYSTTYMIHNIYRPEVHPEVLWIYKISFMYYGIVSGAVTLVVSILVSLITGRKKKVNSKLIYNWHKHCFCCFGSSCKKCLQCGNDPEYDEDEPIDTTEDTTKASNKTSKESVNTNDVDNEIQSYDENYLENKIRKINKASITNDVTRDNLDNSNILTKKDDNFMITTDTFKVDHSAGRKIRKSVTALGEEDNINQPIIFNDNLTSYI